MILDMIVRKSPAGFRAVLRGIQPNGTERILYEGPAHSAARDAQADLNAAVQGLHRKTRPEQPEGAEEDGDEE